MNETLSIRVCEVISVAEQFGEQIKKAFEKVVRVFRGTENFVAKIMRVMFHNPALRPRPPTVNNKAILVKPRMSVRFAVIRGFILET